MFAQGDGGIFGTGQCTLAGGDLAFQPFQRRSPQSAAMDPVRAGIGHKAEAFQLADGLAADRDTAGFIQRQ